MKSRWALVGLAVILSAAVISGCSSSDDGAPSASATVPIDDTKPASEPTRLVVVGQPAVELPQLARPHADEQVLERVEQMQQAERHAVGIGMGAGCGNGRGRGRGSALLGCHDGLDGICFGLNHVLFLPSQ